MITNVRRFSSVLLAAALTVLGTSGAAAAASTINFAEPSWPGVNVKTEIAQQLLEALGYKVKTTSLDLPFVFRSLKSGDTDVFLGAWLPAQNKMLDPALKKHEIVKLAANLDGAKQGLAVPDYVWKNGIHSVKDLAAQGDRFDRKIYGIESGSAMNQSFNTAIKNDYEGLGGWKVVPSSTAVMLAQVERSTSKQQPIVFYGWRPHWMNIKFNMRYLIDKKDSKIAGVTARVFTLTSAGFPKQQPNVTRFLKQFHVTAKTQSAWIYQYSHENKEKSEVANTWLKGHKAIVSRWLKGVKTASGSPALAAYRKQYQ